MRIKYFRELQKYPLSNLATQLNCTLENLYIHLDPLIQAGIIKLGKNLDFSITYVGIIELKDLLLFIYPKCFTTSPNHKICKKILRTLAKYHKDSISLDGRSVNPHNISNKLSLILSIIEDYSEKGYYREEKTELRNDSDGLIDWIHTVSDTIPIIQNNIPHYVDILSRHEVQDFEDPMFLLHKLIVWECYDFLKQIGLDYLFILYDLSVPDYSFDSLGSKSLLINLIRKSMNLCFATRKLETLQLMFDYLSENYTTSKKQFILFGTKDYEVIWELMCRTAFDNDLNRHICELPIYSEKYNSLSSKELISCLERPYWKIAVDNQRKFLTAPLRPDTIKILKNRDRYDCFIIDAKYYLPYPGDELENYPETADISKQHIYEFLLKKQFPDENFQVKNIFVMPSEETEPILIGYCEFSSLREKLNLSTIRGVSVPWSIMCECYLNNVPLSKEMLQRITSL